jgi:hypothetical protein
VDLAFVGAASHGLIHCPDVAFAIPTRICSELSRGSIAEDVAGTHRHFAKRNRAGKIPEPIQPLFISTFIARYQGGARRTLRYTVATHARRCRIIDRSIYAPQHPR